MPPFLRVSGRHSSRNHGEIGSMTKPKRPTRYSPEGQGSDALPGPRLPPGGDNFGKSGLLIGDDRGDYDPVIAVLREECMLILLPGFTGTKRIDCFPSGELFIVFSAAGVRSR